jgi:hypothetical protein
MIKARKEKSRGLFCVQIANDKKKSKRDFPCALTAALWLDRSCMEGDIRLD